MNNGLIISDDEYIYSEKSLYAYLKVIMSCGKEYCNIIEELISCGINDENISVKLSLLEENVSEVLNDLKSISEEVSGMGCDYISKIDKTDKFIY